MYFLFFTLIYSIEISKTGYYATSIDGAGTQINFSLLSLADYEYYILFCSYDQSLTINGFVLSNCIYKLSNLTTSMEIKTSISSFLSFGLFLIPKTHDTLEYLFLPSGSSTYSISKYSSSSKSYLLLIINNDPINIQISKGSDDSNLIYYSTEGNLFEQKIDFTSIPSSKIIAIRYDHSMSGRTDTTYSISTSTNSKTVNYYDDSGSPLFFKKPIVVNFLEAKNDYRVTYGRNSYLVSSSNSLTFKIPSHTVIIFTRFADLSGIANASDTYLNLFGTDEILALDFRSNGTLNISTMKSTAYCDFVAFNFSTAKYDHHLVLVGTKAYRHKLLDGGNKYCTYSTGASKIIPESNIRHYSIDQFGKRKYDETYDEKSIDGPSITIYLSSSSMMNNKMTFINNGTSNETNYILHTYSKQHFYQIGFYSPSDIMTHAEEGEEIDPDNASKISPGKIAGIIIGAVVVLLIIIAIPVICLIYGHHSTDVQEYPLQSNPLNLNLETSGRPVQKPTYYPERSQRTQSYSRPLVNPYPQQQQVPYYAQPPSPQDGYITPAPIMPLYPAPETKDGYL